MSVIVPAYNAGPFIERTLWSALKQTHTALEVIVIDDGSTDSTAKIAHTIAQADQRVRVISVPNGGVAKARNIGIHEAAGEFVSFLDADDLWHSTKVELQVAALHAMKTAAAVYALARDIDVDDRVLQEGKPVVYSGYTFARHLYIKPIGNGSALLVRREQALAVGGYESSWAARGLGGCEDLDFELKIAAKYPITAVPLYLIGYRVSPGNMSSNRIRMARAAISTVKFHLASGPKLPKWAAKVACDAVAAYAVASYARGRHWRLAALELFQLSRSDLRRAISIVLWIIKQEIAAFRQSVNEQKAKLPLRPLFYELDPSFGVDVSLSIRGARDQRIIQELSKLDGTLAHAMNAEAKGHETLHE